MVDQMGLKIAGRYRWVNVSDDDGGAGVVNKERKLWDAAPESVWS